MWNRSKNHIDDEKLDRLSDELLRSLEASEAEINTAATSPFLYRRIHARIESEKRRLSEESNPWLALMLQVRQAIPVFALLAVVALISTLYLHKDVTTPGNKPQQGQQVTMVAGLPAFLQDVQDDVEESLIGWQGNQSGKRNE